QLPKNVPRRKSRKQPSPDRLILNSAPFGPCIVGKVVGLLQELLDLHCGYRGLRTVAFSPDGNSLACASFDSLRVWEARPRSDADLSGNPPAKCQSGLPARASKVATGLIEWEKTAHCRASRTSTTWRKQAKNTSCWASSKSSRSAEPRQRATRYARTT